MDGILNNVVKPLNCNSENITIEWEDFKNQLDLLFKLKGVDKPEEKKSLVLLLGGQDLRRICATLPEEEGRGNSVSNEYGIFLNKLDEFFIQKRSKRFERHIFRGLKQKEGEKFDKFVLRLRSQSLKCEWSLGQMNDNIVDQIVEGCLQEKLRAKIMEKDLDLEEAVQLGNSVETMIEQQKQFKDFGHTSKSEEVNAVESKSKFANVTCSRCGHKGHTGAYPKCPALDKVCNSCKGVGHFANRCRAKRKPEEFTRKWIPKRQKTNALKKEVNVLEESEDENEDGYTFHLGCMDKIPVKIGGIEMEFIVDSGATVNVLSVSDWEWLKGKKVKVSDQKSDPEKKLLAYGSTTPLKVIGSFLAQIEVGKSTKTDRFYVLQEGKHSLIGNSLAKSLGILKIGVDINLVEENKSVFPALKGIEVKINLDKEVAPVFQPYRRVPLELEKKVAARVEELVQKDIIEKVDGHSSWASPLVVVPKTNGDIRLCVDMRRANKAVLVETFPFPNIEEMMVKLNGAQVFSKIDIKDAYYQVRLAEDSRDITTFITKGN